MENSKIPSIESLPPPTLPLTTSRFFDGRNDDGESIPFHSWVRHTQKKLFKLNRKRAAYIKDVPNSTKSIPATALSDEAKVKEYAYELLKELIPEWKHITSVHELKLVRLSGAMTNTMFVCSCIEKPPNSPIKTPPKILLRVYGQGSEQFFDRQREIFILQVLSCMDVGPKLMGMFENGRFEEFIESTSLRSNDLFQVDTSKAIAEKLFGIHSLVGIIPSVDENKGLFKRKYESELWTRLEDWFKKAQVAAKKFQANTIISSIDFDQLREEVETVKKRVEKMDSPVVFTHNDLQYGNILRREPDGDILLIDFEYACYSYRGFDIANHFCEWAADYHSEKPHLLDFSKYPSEQEQVRFFNAYLDERDRFIQSRLNYRRASFSSIQPLTAETTRIVSSINPQSHPSNAGAEHPLVSPRLRPRNYPGPSPSLSPDASPSLSPMLTPQILKEFRQREIEHLMLETKYFTLLSHILWGLWGIIQASQSVIDFDYISYASQRIKEYQKLKQSLEI